jgi:hypothetical protein
MREWIKRLVVVAALLCAAPAWAGSIFLTGHDPDFHATLGGNTTGAINITNAAINFITDPAFNPFSNSGIHKFLFVESSIAPPPGHTVGLNGIVAAGYTEGVDFVHADASTLGAELLNLGTTYDAIVIASDFGGVLTQAELDILNLQSAVIKAFIEAGGGLYAMAESNGGAGLTPNGGQFGYLPFVTSSTQLDQSEIGFTVTPFGASLGLTDVDVNGNASHNIFNSFAPLSIVDLDASGHILTVAGRLDVIPPGPVPEPTTVVFLSAGLLATGPIRRKRQ